MGLADIITNLNATLVARGIDEDRLFTGAEHLRKHGAPPRIVWTPGRRETIGPAAKGGWNPRPLRTRNAALDAHCWGADLASTEQLLNDVVAAVHAVAHGAYQTPGVEWFGVDGDVVKVGFVAVVSFTFEVPIVAPTKTTATIATVAQAEAIETS